MKLTTFVCLILMSLIPVAMDSCAALKAKLETPVGQAVAAQTQTLLTKFVFAAGADKLTGANWSDSAAAGIYAAQTELAENPLALNTMLGTFLPVDSSWTAVIDGLVCRLIKGDLNTKAERVAALNAIAQTLNTSAAAARSSAQ